MLEKIFHLSDNKTNVKTEILAGFTTFMTMAYILIVNPQILHKTGMPMEAVFAATALASFIGTIIMAFVANYPFGMAPGMGLNALFTYTICITMHFSWQTALAASFIEGIIFLLLNVFKVRQYIIDSVPQTLKYAISIGIGFFITFIGLQDAGIIVKSDGTLVTLANMKSPTVLLAVLGVLLIAVLYNRGIKGSFIIGMVVIYVLGIIFGLSPAPSKAFSVPPSVAPVFLKFDFSHAMTFKIIPVILAMLFVDIFDSIGTLIGLASKAGYLDKDGNVKNADKVLTADAVGSTIGACLGTSTPVAFVESASGIAEGGRTGLTSFVVGVLFLVSLFFGGLIGIVPSEATAPALVIVGVLMLGAVKEIDFDDFTEALPAFFTIAIMPFSYSIANGVAAGIIFYPIMKLVTGKYKDVHPIMYVLALLFIFRFVMLPQ